ncbi:MAG: hypothetical protein ABS62_00840 [Microbacterium sp. SCN 70-200]|nr:MAG: hypothetical protein ABS62_00840 [Microbacterium sp. SCN 70-200]OJV84727.1 MAG: hypothetical protein BGO46_04910 [Microbacterium sp. 70-16]
MGVSGVLGTPPPRALPITIGPDRITMRLQYWHPPLDGVTVTAAVVRAVSVAIEGADWHGTVSSTPGEPPLVPPDAI